MATRQLRKTLRKPVYVIFAFVQPVMFVLLFRYVFGGAINTGDVDYVDFLMPGIIVQTAVFGALMTGIGLNTDVATGVVDRFRSLPISRSAVLFGRTAADIVQNVMTLIVMLLVGVAVGFRPSEPVYDIALALLVVLAFSYTFSWISAFVGLSVKDPETAQSAGFIWVFPLTFVSSAFVPGGLDAGLAGGVRERQPDHARRQHRAGADDRRGRRGRSAARDARVARRATGRIRAALRARLPARMSRALLTSMRCSIAT